MPDTPARCEPPDALRKVDGLHWVQAPYSDKPEPCMWDCSPEPHWAEPLCWSVSEATARGYRYLSPVPSPSEIAALVRAGRALRDAEHRPYWDDRIISTALLYALSAALDAPSFKEIGNGE